MEVYARVRRAIQVDGMSQREAAREFGLARKTIRKMLEYSIPPGYERKKPVVKPKLGPWLGIIDQILEDDQTQPKKQRHTAKRIWERLKSEHAFTGGYTVVKDYVREARVRHKEVFVPLAHPPGEAQADFGEAMVVIAGVEQKAHFLCMDLPHSDDSFVVAFPAENTESFLEGHNRAFAHFGGVPQTRSCTTTRASRWPGSPGRANASPPKRSASCNRTISLQPSSDVPARATTKATWKGWWVTRGATSWCRCHAWPVGTS